MIFYLAKQCPFRFSSPFSDMYAKTINNIAPDTISQTIYGTNDSFHVPIVSQMFTGDTRYKTIGSSEEAIMANHKNEMG